RRRLPPPRRCRGGRESLRILDGYRMRFESDKRRSSKAQRWQLLEEAIPDTGPFYFYARHGAALFVRLLVIAKVGHEQRRLARGHRDPRRTAESRQVPD